MKITRVLLTFLLIAGSLLMRVDGYGNDTFRQIQAVRVNSAINPIVADYLVASITEANASGRVAYLLHLDTPGGLDTAMRSIIQAILGSEIPVIVYVSPPGARAASAGALITLAADIAVMAPGTNIGAAHPVSIGAGGQGEMDETMKGKVVNDAVAYAVSLAEQRGRDVAWAEQIVRDSISTSATEALKLKVIDLIAADEKELLAALDGFRYLRNGQARVLDTKDAQLVYGEMNWRQKILNTISNPNIAYMLLMLGILGIFFEISQPGVILPGVVGALALLLAFIGLQMLPINYIGVLLIILAVVLFVLEVKVVSYGMLTIGGIIAMTMGSLILIDSSAPYQQISLGVIGASVAVFSGFFIFALYFIVRTQKRPAYSGLEGMVGKSGEVVADFDGEGKVFVFSEYWDAVSDEPLRQGDTVEVVAKLDRMRLKVRKAQADTDSKSATSADVAGKQEE